MKKADKIRLSQGMMMAALVSIVLAGVGYLGLDIWLASTQWLLVTVVLALFGVYLRLS
jgi:hypothetical protein